MDHSKITNLPLDPPDDDPEETAHVCPWCGGDSPALDQCCCERCDHLRHIRTSYTSDQCRAALVEIGWQEAALDDLDLDPTGPVSLLYSELRERGDVLRARLAVREAVETPPPPRGGPDRLGECPSCSGGGYGSNGEPCLRCGGYGEIGAE